MSRRKTLPIDSYASCIEATTRLQAMVAEGRIREARTQRMRFCNGCKAQFDSARPCPRCGPGLMPRLWRRMCTGCGAHLVSTDPAWPCPDCSDRKAP